MRTLSTIAVWFVCVSAFAQGTLNFANYAPGVDAAVSDTDWTTKLNGAQWAADLWWAPGIVTDSDLLFSLGTPTNFSTEASGYFFGGVRTLPLPPDSTITAQIRVWSSQSGATWTQARAATDSHIGESILFQVVLTAPSQIPANLTGLNGHPFYLYTIPMEHIVRLKNVGVRSNLFGFTIEPNFKWNVVVEARTQLTNSPLWIPLLFYTFTNTQPVYFTDPYWRNYPSRFFLVRVQN